MKMIEIPVTQEHIDAAVLSEGVSICQRCIVFQALSGAGLNPANVSFSQWWKLGLETPMRLGPECVQLTGMASKDWRTATPRTITVQVPE